MQKLIVGIASLAAGLALAATSAAVKIPPNPRLPAGWSHATINVVQNHKAHTLTYDRGRVQSVSTSSLTLKEPDGTMQTIAISPAARLTINGRPTTLSQVRPRETAVTVGVDGGPAASVKVTIPPALAAQLARQAARQARQQARQARRQGH